MINPGSDHLETSDSADLTVATFDGEPAAWDAFLERPGATFCHRFGWRAVLEDALGHETFWLSAHGHGGSLELENRSDGPGARARLTLPADH